MNLSHARWHAWACLLMFCISAAALADDRKKTDVIVLRNGDHVTGEIMSMQYAQLQLKTDDMGTIAIEWEAIATIQSQYEFNVEEMSGRHHYGIMKSTADGKKVEVDTRMGVQTIDPSQIVRIAQLESTFWERIDGSFSLGYNFAKSTDITVLSGSFDATYRAETVIASLSVDTNSSNTAEEGTIDRDTIGFTYQWLRPDRDFWFGSLSLERNEELGIEARVQGGGGWGRYLKQTSYSELAGVVGVVGNQEWVTGAAGGQLSVEGVLGLNWRLYRLNSPKRNLSASTVLYPGITEGGRYRGNANLSMRFEIISDLFLDLSVYYDYDNQPPDPEASKDDYGVTTSLGYSF